MIVSVRKSSFVAALLLALSAPTSADPLAVQPPRPLAGPYPIACTNLAQDFSRVPPGESAELWWEGVPRSDGSPRYVSDLLAEPANALVARFVAPNDPLLFGPWRGETLEYVLAVCYPTSPQNQRPDYPLPNGAFVPRMQRGSEPPILPDSTTRWPVLGFSHGYVGSPLSDTLLAAIAVFASHGYVVIAPFHGDRRYADLSLDDLAAIIDFPRFTAMQATRPLSVSAALDLVLSHPHWRDVVDPARIGGFGASQGGQTLMLIGGAEITTSIFGTSQQVTRDDRIKAAVGYVPYFGQRILPAFGRDNRGVEGVTLPYLAISGTADTTAPIGLVEEAMSRLRSTRELVALGGTVHGFDPADAGDIFTWSLDWLDALVNDDRIARARLGRMTQVAGGADDVVRTHYIAPAPALADERVVVEFRSNALNHYFITAEPAEIAMLDAGIVVPGWERTGFEFKSWAPGTANGIAACRFFGTPGRGPNSHFFTIDGNECMKVKVNPDWTYEGLAFQALPTGVLTCPVDRAVVWRLYNNGMGGEASHRYLTSHTESGDMVGRGWLVEGPVFCTPP